MIKKVARRGAGWPAAFEEYPDKVSPYKRYFGPNSGESPKLTMLGSQGLPGEPPDASGSIGGSSLKDHFVTEKHDFTDSDPDDPFGTTVGRDGGELPYGESGQELNFTTNSGPLTRSERVFSLLDADNKDRKPNQLTGDLSKKRK